MANLSSDWRELIADIRRAMQREAQAVVAPFTRGGKFDRSSPNQVGHTPVGGGGTGNDRGAGPHALVGDLHTASGLTTGQVLTATGPTTFGFQAPTSQAGSAWSVLSNGDPLAPELVWDSFGAVIATETVR